MEKMCFKCKTIKPLSEFYPHKRMTDGYLNKCKECTRSDVRKHRAANLHAIHEYDRRRAAYPLRKEKVREYQHRRRLKYPYKDRARAAINKAMRSGKLKRGPCAVCGTSERTEAHHVDYTKPLEVVWLCFKHHREIGHGQVVTAA